MMSGKFKDHIPFENDLVGGLISYLSDNNLLSPEETLTIYLNTLKSMNTEQMGNYLGIESLLNTSDSDKIPLLPRS